MITGRATIAGLGTYPCAYNPHERWNGAIVPHFDAMAVRAILADLGQDVTEWAAVPVMDDSGTIVRTRPVMTADGVRWPVGARTWTWSAVDSDGDLARAWVAHRDACASTVCATCAEFAMSAL